MTTGIPAASLKAEIGVDGDDIAARRLDQFGAKVDQTAGRQVASMGRIGGAARTLDRQLSTFGVPGTAALGHFGDALDRAGGKSRTFGQNLAAVGGGELLLVGTALAAVSSKAIQYGSDTAESLSKANVVFGKNADEIDAWSKTAATSMGISRQEALESAGTFGNLFRAMGLIPDVAKDMSTGVVKLSSDLASFNNRDPSDVLIALRAGIVGEFEPLRTLGVNLSANRVQLLAHAQGIKANYNELSASTKAQLIYKLILHDTALAQGDFARTSGGLANQQRIVSAQTKDLEAQLGGVLVPALLTGERAAFGLAHGFQDLNQMSHGLLGTVGLIGVAIPVGVFALERLNVAAGWVFGQFGKLIPVTEAEAAANLELAGSANVAAAAEERLAVSGGAAAAGATAGASALAIEAAAVGVLGIAFGNAKLEQRGREMGGIGEAAIWGGRALSGLIPGLSVVTAGLGFLGFGHKKNADETKKDTVASLQHALALAQEKLQNDKLAGNTRALAADRAHVASINGRLAGAEREVAQAMNSGTGAMNVGTGALNTNAAAADKGKFAYLGLASGVNTAAEAIASIGQRQSSKASPFQLQIDTGDAQDAIAALHAPPDTGSSGGGGGGSGQTATAAAIEQTQKELALRDALRSVGAATSGVTDAQRALSQARGQQALANQAEIQAETRLRNVLQGVSEDTTKARDAQLALTQARNDAAQQAFAVQDAERALELARNGAGLKGFEITDAEATVANSRGAADTANQAVASAEEQLAAVRANGSSTADDVANAEALVAATRTAAAPLMEQATKDEIALNGVRINAKAGDEDIRKAELELSNARIQGKQKTVDLDEAQRVYNGTLNGFPEHSKEAREAQAALTDTQRQARDATRQVADATTALVTAQDQIPTAALGVQRATADLEGKLTAAAGGSGGMAKLSSRSDSMIVKLEAVRAKFLQLAQDSAAATTASTGSVGQGYLAFIEGLQAAVAQEPLLKGAFDGVLADLRSGYQKWLAHLTTSQQVNQHVFSPTTGGVATGYGPTRDLNPTTKGHAAGGTARPGETFTSGEEGFEIMHALPGGGVDILSNPQSRHALSSSSNSSGVEAKLDRLIVLLGAQRPGVHIDQLIARDAEDTARKIDQQQKRQYLLTNL